MINSEKQIQLIGSYKIYDIHETINMKQPNTIKQEMTRKTSTLSDLTLKFAILKLQNHLTIFL